MADGGNKHKRRKTAVEADEDIGEVIGVADYARRQQNTTQATSDSTSTATTTISAPQSGLGFLYQRLPPSYFPKELANKKTFSVPDFLKPFMPANVDASEIFVKKVRNKVLLLDNKKVVDNIEQRKEKQLKKKKAKVMGSKERRQKKLFIVKDENKKYEMYLPLHEMWKQYMTELVGTSQASTFATKLMKADFHGCILTVCRSKCPTNIGISGIMIQETEGTFQIITRDNKLKVVPKKNNVFSFVFDNKLITLYGNNLLYKASERSARKYKYKPTVEM